MSRTGILSYLLRSIGFCLISLTLLYYIREASYAKIPWLNADALKNTWDNNNGYVAHLVKLHREEIANINSQTKNLTNDVAVLFKTEDKTITRIIANLNDSAKSLTKIPRSRGLESVKQNISHHPPVQYKHSRSKCVFPVHCKGNITNPPFHYDLTPVNMRAVEKDHPDVTAGHWQPANCWSDTIAIIIPFRDRAEHLNIVMKNIIKFLKAQHKSFAIYLIEQAGDTLFNRASLLNIGFLEAMKRYNYSCFIFHDVDMIPVRLCNIYDCPRTGARHMAVSINANPTKIYYDNFTGAALTLSTWAMKRINGFTNIMYGWGGEDDDTFARLVNANITIERFHSDVANYTTVKHTRDKTNPKVSRSLDICYQTSLHYKQDGLNNVKYKLVSSVKYPLFTKITVELKGPKTQEEAYSYFDEKRITYLSKLMKASDIL